MAMRYQIGQKITVVAFHVKDGNFLGDCVFFHPLQYSCVAMQFVTLTCIEHHRVSLTYEAEDAAPSADGFRFVDGSGNIWDNQWPRASYGQADDSNDWRFSSTDVNRKFPALPYHWVDFAHYMENLLHGIFVLDNQGMQNEKHALMEHRDRCKYQFEVAVRAKLDIQPSTFSIKGVDDVKTIPGWYEVTINYE